MQRTEAPAHAQSFRHGRFPRRPVVLADDAALYLRLFAGREAFGILPWNAVSGHDHDAQAQLLSIYVWPGWESALPQESRQGPLRVESPFRLRVDLRQFEHAEQLAQLLAARQQPPRGAPSGHRAPPPRAPQPTPPPTDRLLVHARSAELLSIEFRPRSPSRQIALWLGASALLAVLVLPFTLALARGGRTLWGLALLPLAWSAPALLAFVLLALRPRRGEWLILGGQNLRLGTQRGRSRSERCAHFHRLRCRRADGGLELQLDEREPLRLDWMLRVDERDWLQREIQRFAGDC